MDQAGKGGYLLRKGLFSSYFYDKIFTVYINREGIS